MATGARAPYIRGLMRPALVFLLAIWPSGRLVAWQCPDGAPPPCARTPAAARPAPAPDPNRIAIFPFRVTTSDTLLGEGIAELIAGAFTGVGGPRAVPMGNVIRGWRDAGGAPRVPLPTPAAERVTRQLGAGLYVDGSIVGLGQRLTLSATVTGLADGSVRRAPPVQGSADSLPALVDRLTAGLLQAAGVSRAGQAVRVSDSPEAVRQYIEGMNWFRRFRFAEAAAAFERAFAIDPQLARAAFMRWQCTGWGPGQGTADPDLWKARTIALRDRLSSQDQLVLDAAVGTLAFQERMVASNPDLPEVWYYIGDNYYHGARVRGWTASLARARDAFERSVALDSQPTSLHHLVEIGLWTRDTVLLRSAWAAFDRVAPYDYGLGQMVAWRLGDTRMLEAMRRRPPRGTPDTMNVAEVYWLGPSIGMPAALVDEAFERSRTLPAANVFADSRIMYFLTAMNAGRPAAAERATRAPPRDTAVFRGFNADVWLMVAAVMNDGDTVLALAARERVLAARYPDSNAIAVARCGTALYDRLRGDSVVVEEDLLNGHEQSGCVVALRLVAATRAGTLDSAAIARYDSAWDAHPGSLLWPTTGLFRMLSARAWESIGNRPLALAQARYVGVGWPPDFLTAQKRVLEARTAATLGDTIGAIRAYREYLDLRRDAEPALIPQRDSVQTELNRLLGVRPGGR